MRRSDPLGAFVAIGAIIGVLGLGLVLGPRTEAPAPPEPVAAPEPAPEPAPPVEEPEALEEEPTFERLAPLQLRIGAISVDAPVVPVGIKPDRAMEIPDDVTEIGWYDPDGRGVVPGQIGTAVFSSHVDSRSQGRGVLFDLRLIQVGETIEVELADGTMQTWRVTEVAQYPKATIDLNAIFTWGGPSRLVVITCGGEFDRAARSYKDNVVVYAEPADDGEDAGSTGGDAPA
jgi:hypothetical protein